MDEISIWLTISIGVYNGEKYIAECLDSILNKNVEFGYEIIVIDDGSKDKTLDILKKYEKDFPNQVKVFSKENKGQGSTYNIGIKEAKGKYIVFVDGDDALVMDELEDIYKKSEQNCKEYDLILHNCISIDPKQKGLIEYYTDVENEGRREANQPLSEGEYNFSDIWNKCCRLIHNNIFLTAFIRKNNIFADETYKYGADAILEVKVAAYAKSVLCTHNEAYVYRISDEQVTDLKKLSRMYEDRLRLVTSAVRYYDIMVDTCEQTEERYEIIRTCICNICGLAYIAALYSDHIYRNMKQINGLLRSKKEIWRSMNWRLKVVRSNAFVTYPFLREYVRRRYRKIKM